MPLTSERRQSLIDRLSKIPGDDPVWPVLLAAFQAVEDGRNEFECPYCGQSVTIDPPQKCCCRTYPKHGISKQ